MKISELLNEIATYKNADRFPRFVIVDGINDSQLIIEGESKNVVYVWGIFNQGNEWIFFETDYDRGYIFFNESFDSEDEACNYAREHFIMISNSFSASPKSKYDIGIRYIQKEYGYSDDIAENMLNEICKYDDIFEEFSNYIRVKKMHKKDKTQVIVEGITAEKLVVEYKFSILEAYTILKKLRDTPQETLTYLKVI